MTDVERTIPDAETVRSQTQRGLELMHRFWPTNSSGFAPTVNPSNKPLDGYQCQACHIEKRLPWEPLRTVPPRVTALETLCRDHGGPVRRPIEEDDDD